MSMVNRARARERFEVRVNEQAGAILSANPDITPADMLADLGSIMDPELSGGLIRSPIFRAAVAARIRFQTGMDIDARVPVNPRDMEDPFSPDEEPMVPGIPPTPAAVVKVEKPMPEPVKVPAAPVVPENPLDVAGALVKAWAALGRRDAFADSIVAFHRARGFLSSRQVWHLENLVKRETARLAWLRKVAA
jgi:hypothetical protein